MLKWGGPILLLLIALAWTISLRWRVTYLGKPSSTQTGFTMLTGGCLLLFPTALSPNPGGWHFVRHPESPHWFEFHRGPVIFILPLWIPFVLIAVPMVLVWWLDRRRIPPGHCQRCRYDLTGNTSGTCPECGTAVSPDTNVPVR